MTTNRSGSRKRGATLTEVVIASALFVMMLGGVVTMGIQASSNWATGTSRIMSDDAASTALQTIAREVRAGLECTVNAAGTEATITLPSTNAEGDYDRYTAGAVTRYYLSGTQLMKQVGSATATVLARRVTSVKFELQSSMLYIAITSRRQNGNKYADTTLTTQVGLRNEMVY